MTKKNNMITSIDLEETFGKIQLFHTKNNQLWIERNYLKIINARKKRLTTNNTLNSERIGFFFSSLRSDKEERWSFLSPLFSIFLEVQARLIRQDKGSKMYLLFVNNM